MKRTVLTAAFVALVCGVCSWANEASDAVDARTLFNALRNDDMAYLERNLERIPDLKIRDQNGNSLIHALIAPGQVMPPDPPPPPVSKRSIRNVSHNGQRITIIEGVGQPSMISLHPIQLSRLRPADGAVHEPLRARMALIRKLAARGVPINGANSAGQTPLHLAVRYDAAIPPTVKIIDGYAQPVRDPAQHCRFVDFLIGLGADPRLADAEGRTPMFLAKSEVQALLLKRGASLEDRNKEGKTPFLESNPANAIYLMQLGADVHALDSRGRNRWFFLRGDGWDQLADELLARKVNMEQRGANGGTALMTYFEKEYLPQALYLIEHGAATAQADKEGRTPLHLAAVNHSLELVTLLLQRGAAVDARDHSGETPLYKACRHRGCVDLLLDRGADPAVVNRRGRNVLHELADERDRRALEMLAFFIARKVPLDRRDRERKTPLALAYDNSNLEAVKRLLENGANPDPAGYGEWSLLDRAESDKKTTAVELLRKHGARHGRLWASRHRMLLFYAFFAMGIFPLAVLVFGLLKPSLFKSSLRRIMPPLFMSLGICFLAVIVLTGITGERDFVPLFLILALPLLVELLALLAAIRTLVDRVAPGPGIIFSLLTAAGAPALLYGILWPISSGFKGEGGMALGYMLYFGSYAATIATLAYALFAWIKKISCRS